MNGLGLLSDSHQKFILSYKAKPHAGWKLLGSVLLYVVLTCQALWLIAVRISLNPSLLSKETLGLIGMGIIFLLIQFVAFRSGQVRYYRKWLAEYWHRNVRGFTLCVACDPDEDNGALFYVGLVPRWDKNEFKPQRDYPKDRWSQVNVFYPLGGWFSRMRMQLYYGDRGEATRVPNKYWKIRKDRHTDFWVYLSPESDRKLHLPLYMAARLMSEKCFDSQWTSTLDTLFSRHATTAALLARETRICTEALTMITSTIQAINDTKRFIRSKEGEALREKLEVDFIDLLRELLTSDVRRKPFADQIREREHQLAEAASDIPF